VKKVFLILAIFACTFCTKKKDKHPKGLYSEEQVAVFMKDVYLLQEQIQEMKLKDDSAKKVFAYYEKQLFEKHDMDDSIYRESFEYYMDDVSGLANIYEIIADSLSLEERLINANKYTEEDLKEMEH
jgi:hypothetical protein